MYKVTMIVNPRAGPNKFKKEATQIMTKLNHFFGNVDCHETKKEGDAGRLAISCAVESDLLIVAGGDGTVFEVINSISALHSRPMLAIIPSGIINNIAKSLDISMNPDCAAQQIIEGNTSLIDIGFDGEQYFLNFWGIGTASSKTPKQNISGIRSVFARLPYFLETIKNTRQINSFQYECSSRHHYLAGRADFILIVNKPFTADIFHSLANVDPTDGLLDLIIIRESRLNAFLSLTEEEKSISTIDNDNVLHIQSDHFTINTSPHDVIKFNDNKESRLPAEIRAFPSHLKVITG